MDLNMAVKFRENGIDGILTWQSINSMSPNETPACIIHGHTCVHAGVKLIFQRLSPSKQITECTMSSPTHR